jgi:hypothetical protein
MPSSSGDKATANADMSASVTRSVGSYTRVATGLIAGIESPLDRLSQPRKKPKKAKERGSKDQPTA